jgi:predicted methyltransferase
MVWRMPLFGLRTSGLLLLPILACGTVTPPQAPPSPAPASHPEEPASTAAIGGDPVSARWTAGMHSSARLLADADYATGRAAIEAAMRGSHRLPGAVARDKYRHPADTLEFFGFTPTMTVLDIAPGAGWYTELLAPALAKHGAYLTTVTDPSEGPGSNWGTSLSQQFVSLLNQSPELYGKVHTIVVKYAAPQLDLDGTVDMVLVMRGVHMMKNWGTLDTWLQASFRALKPGGILGIEDHRAAPNTNPELCASTGYLPEAWVIAKVEAAGFVLAGRSEINANPKDDRDHPKGVWTLPPELALNQVDREKYVAIGESDRMTLKFVKGAAARATRPVQ